MKVHNFVAGLVVGSVVSVLACKLLSKKCCCSKSTKTEEDLEQANATIDSLRSSVDCFSKQLSERITSEQTYAARCEELDAKVKSQAAEIENLKNVCAAQDAQNKKLGGV